MGTLKVTIEAEFLCGCWFDFENKEEVTQQCMYHNQKLVMRSDVKKMFDKPSNNVVNIFDTEYTPAPVDRSKKRKRS